MSTSGRSSFTGSCSSGAPQDAEPYLSIGHAEKTLGRAPAAIAAYRQAAACRGDFGDAYWSLANLKTYRFTDEELAQLRAALAAPATALVDRYHLCFALGKALEDRGEFAESLRHYELGNELKRAECRYRAGAHRDQYRSSRSRSARASSSPRAAAAGIRARIRSSSSGCRAPARRCSSRSWHRTRRSRARRSCRTCSRSSAACAASGRRRREPRYPRILTTLSAADFAGLGQQYLDGTRVYRSGKPHFIDKMPNNFRHLGLIHLMLPNARIIDARREPMACCFSNLKQLFANGQEFTYSIEDIARYYRTYLELMRHWDRVLPGRILRVFHEDVVDDLEGNVRRLLDFCGLEFEPQCVAFHETKRSVRTASSEQVRQPIFREGLEQWKHFEPWLGPLRDALGDALGQYRG